MPNAGYRLARRFAVGRAVAQAPMARAAIDEIPLRFDQRAVICAALPRATMYSAASRPHLCWPIQPSLFRQAVCLFESWEAFAAGLAVLNRRRSWKAGKHSAVAERQHVHAQLARVPFLNLRHLGKT